MDSDLATHIATLTDRNLCLEKEAENYERELSALRASRGSLELEIRKRSTSLPGESFESEGGMIGKSLNMFQFPMMLISGLQNLILSAVMNSCESSSGTYAFWRIL